MIDIEMHSARKMAPAELSASVEIGAGVMPGAIENLKARVRKMRGEPFGAQQRL
jgi:hypothetical protein